MAVDNRPFKSKEQDGQGNEVIIRDQQLVEQGTATTMASGACFETRDVDDRPVKIPRDNMMNIVLECIGIILNDSSRNLGTNVQKALGLQGNTVGHSTVADFASVLGVQNFYHKTLGRNQYPSLADTDNNVVYFAADALAQRAMSDWPSGVTTDAESVFFKASTGSYGLQVLFNSTGFICVRQQSGGSWQTWKKATLV
jgi:hypothetical protein